MTERDNMPILVGALRSALKRLEEQEELAPDDPALLEIKRSILRTIARRNQEDETPPDPGAK